MINYVQLKDGIVFATLITENEIEENASIIKVDNAAPEELLNKKYENGSFVDSTKIKYAKIENGIVVGFEEVYHSSQVDGPIVSSDDVKVFWTWDGESFAEPVVEETPIPVEPTQP